MAGGNAVTGGDSLLLLISEAGLDSGTLAGNGTDVATGTLAFTAGTTAVNTFAFSTDLGGLNGNTDADPNIELVWVRIDSTHIEGRYDSALGPAAITLTLTPPTGGIASGATKSVTVTAKLEDNLENTNADNIATLLNLGSVGIVATDAGGATATDTLNLNEQDDVPVVLAGTSASITVFEDALPGGNLDNDGNGTPDVSPSGNTAAFTNAALQALVNPGADAPVVYRLRVATALTQVVDSAGHQVTSGGHAVFYQFVDDSTASIFGPATLGEKLFAFADGQDNGGTFDQAHDKLVFLLTNNHDGTFTFNMMGPVDHPAGSGDVAKLAIDLSPEFAPADFDDDKPHLNPSQTLVYVENDVPAAVADAASTAQNTPLTYNVLANDNPGADAGLHLTAASVPAAAGTVTFTATGTITFTPATDFTGSAVVAYTENDADGDASSTTLTVTVGGGASTPVTGGNSVSLLVDEAGLPAGTGEGNGSNVATGALAFTAGSAAVNSFAFSTDLSALNGNTDLDPTVELTWIWIDATHIEARFGGAGGATAISLTLAAPAGGIAAGATGAATVTAALVGNLENDVGDNIATLLNLGSVGIIATDTNGATAADIVALSEKDDVPLVLAGTSASIKVFEDALPGGNLDNDGNGTADVSPSGATAVFTDAALQALIDPGADAPVVYRLRLATSLTPVVDSSGNTITSGGHAVYYQFVDANTQSIFGPADPGIKLFAFSDAQDNGGTYDATHDKVVFLFTNNQDGSFTFKLMGPLDQAAGSGDTGTVSIDLSPEFAPADFDDDKPHLNAGQAVVVVENDVPVAAADTATTAKNTPIAFNVLTNDNFGADGGVVLTAATVGAAQGTVTFTSAGAVTFTPAAGFTGVATIAYTEKDADGDSASSTLAVTVTGGTLATPAVALSNDDGVSIAGAIANDATPHVTGTTLAGATITVSDGTTVVGTTVANAVTGAFSVVTSSLVNGAHTLSVVASDGVGGTSLPATVHVSIDTVGTMDGTSGADRIVSEGAATVLQGAADNDTLIAGIGNDSLDGGTGVDTMSGGAGNDSYAVDSASDVVTEAVGGGTDTVRTTVSYTLGATSEVEVLATTNNAGTAAINLTGNGFANTITGNAGNNTIDGQGGADTMNGLGGNDTYIVDNANDVINEAVGGGTDTVLASVSYTLKTGSDVEILSTTNTAGTAAINLTGNAIANALMGNAGANILDGKGGADVLAGLGGNDTYIVDSANDLVLEAVGGGSDTVLTSVSYTLAASREIEFLATTSAAGTAAINLTGNEISNTLTGNAGANTLDGKGGADVLNGLGGNDTYFVDNSGDVVNEAAGGGTDKVLASVSYVLKAGSQVEALSTTSDAGTAAINLTGNELANTLTGNAGANALDGKGGADVLNGLGGNDTYFVDNAGDVVNEAAGGGTDKVLASVSYVLKAGSQVEALSTTSDAGTAAINLTGNELANTLTGNAGNNVLAGGSGNDTLWGLGGRDTFLFNTSLNILNNIDRIGDFVAADDTVQLSSSVFAALNPTHLATPFVLPANQFLVIGAHAQDSNDHILYNASSGALYYDADGNGLGLAIQFATLVTHPTITSADFVVA